MWIVKIRNEDSNKKNQELDRASLNFTTKTENRLEMNRIRVQI